MRFAWLNKLGIVLAAAGLMAASARGQVNPHTQIRWPSCTGANQVYSITSNSCIAQGTAANPAGSVNGQVQIYLGGIFGASAATLDVPGNFSTPGSVTAASANISGNVSAGNVSTPGNVTAGTAIYGPPPPAGGNGCAFFGNSITAGGDNGTTSSYPKEIHVLMGQPECNYGIGGQRSGDIVSRMNAYAGQSQQTFAAGFTIPTSGSVDIQFQPGYEPAFNLVGRLNMYPATGVPIQFTVGGVTYSGGVLVHTGTIPNFTYAFTPFSYPGSPVVVPISTAWTTQLDPNMFNGCNGIEAGENNYASAAQVEQDVDAAVAVMSSHSACYVVMPILNTNAPTGWSGASGYVALMAINNFWAGEFGKHYFDIRSFLVSQYNPGDAVDVIDHGHDVPPSSLKKNNQATGTLGAAISDTVTCAITFGSTIAANQSVTVDTEKILITGGSEGAYTCTRGYLGTTAATHLINAAWTTAGTLLAAITDTSTCAITFGSTLANGASVTVDTERIYITSGNDGAYVCTRAWGSTAATHINGSEWRAIDPLHPGSNSYSAANPNYQNGNVAIANYYVNTWLLNSSSSPVVSTAYYNSQNVARNRQPMTPSTLCLLNNTDGGCLWSVSAGWYFHNLTNLFGCSLDNSCFTNLGSVTQTGWGEANFSKIVRGLSFKACPFTAGAYGSPCNLLTASGLQFGGAGPTANSYSGSNALGTVIVNTTTAVKTTGHPGCWDVNGELVDPGTVACPSGGPAGSFVLPMPAFCNGVVGTGNGTAYILAPGAQSTSGTGCAVTTVSPMPTAVAGTVTGCSATASVGGAAADSGAVKLLKFTWNGTSAWTLASTTAICTFGIQAAAAACTSGVLSVTFGTTNSVPDAYAFSVTTKAVAGADTTANVRANCSLVVPVQ